MKAISSNKNNTLEEGQFFIHINRRENIHGLIQNIIYFKHENKARINSKVVLQYYINPNKAGLFEGSFFWAGKFDPPPFMFQEVLI